MNFTLLLSLFAFLLFADYAQSLPLTFHSTSASLIPFGGTPTDTTAALLCLEGPSDSLSNILSELQQSPLAALWAHSVVSSEACATRNFTSGGDADVCFGERNITAHFTALSLPEYPGVPQPSERSNLWQYSTIESAVLISHDFHSHQPNGTAASKVCTRDYLPQSPFIPAPPPSPAQPESLKALAPQIQSSVGSHVPDAGLNCNEGPLTGEFTVFDMVEALKGNSLAALQQTDGVQNVSCAQRGFPSMQMNPDHCYPPATMWSTTSAFNLYKAMWLETGAMLAYDFNHHAEHGTGVRMAECACRPESNLRKTLPAGFCSTSAMQFIQRPLPRVLQYRHVPEQTASWVRTTAAAPWKGRNMASTVAFEGQVFIYGGDNHVDHNFNDVWSSVDGTNWKELIPDGAAPWEERSCMPSVVHQGRIRMMGGCHGYKRFNDVWETTDGRTWTKITDNAGWSKRCCMPAVVYNGAIVISGGHDASTYRNDVWRSVDGVNWIEVTPAAEWPSRDGHMAVILGSSIIIAGGHDAHTDQKQWHGDVWRSADGGHSWSQLTAAAEFPARDGGFATVVNDTIVVMGGFAGSNFYNDTWTSKTGEHWTMSQGPVDWAGRSFFNAAIMPNGAVMLAGGWLSGWTGTPEVGNDVWVGLPITDAL